MNVLSLFDGMSCGQIALIELGVKIDKYYASEIDKFAIKQTQLNFPDTIQLGSVTEWRTWNIDWSSINLICAGSPCQGFSFAGKQLAFDDPRSKLFFVFVEILNHCKKFNPDVKFLLENVDMGKDHLRIISEYVGIFPTKINSALVSAQNRERWYWTNIRTKQVGLFDELYTDIPQPEDKGILLRDILQPENEIDKKYYLSTVAMDRIRRKTYSNPQVNPYKTGTLDTKNNSGQLSVNSGTTLISGRGSNGSIKINNSGKSEPLSSRNDCAWDMALKVDKNGVPKSNQNKADSLTIGGHGCGNHSDMDIICVASRGRNPENPSDRRTGIPTEQRLEPNMNNKTNTLTSVAKDNLILTKNYTQWDVSGKGYKSQQDRAFYEDTKHGTLSSSENKTGFFENGTLRRLTPIECARLQTIPDWNRWECSDSQIYHMLGNGWTVKIIMHILSFML